LTANKPQLTRGEYKMYHAIFQFFLAKNLKKNIHNLQKRAAYKSAEYEDKIYNAINIQTVSE
jgi:hypothetical protein